MLKNLPIFGHNLFSKARLTSFNSSESFVVPADYPVNVGDEINIMLWGRINEEYKLPVSRDGSINIPRIGPVPVAGSTFNSMHNNLLERIKKIEGINATISRGQLRTSGGYIVGEVKSPGFYTISALSNVTNALFAAGGPTTDGSLRNIQLKRNGTLVSNVDFYDFLLSGTDRSSLRLQPGDVINVPVTKSMVAVAGNVRRSALYEIRGKTNLQDILTLAGGFTPSAWVNKIQI
jgi:protein involved in polysaccharide export with SLBB domain